MSRPLLIMVAGPYRSGGADRDQQERNLRLMNEAALAVWERGHTPIIGVNAVLPIVHVAGESRYKELMMPICLDLPRSRRPLRCGFAHRRRVKRGG